MNKKEKMIFILGICGDIWIDTIKEIFVTESYFRKKTVQYRKEGLIKSVRQDAFTTYQLTKAGKEYFREKYPEEYDYFVYRDGNKVHQSNEENIRRRKATLGQVYLNMIDARVSLLQRDKPTLFIEHGWNQNIYEDMGSGAYYSAVEMKERMQQEQRGSRLCGLLFTQKDKNAYIVYNMMGRNIEIYQKTEIKAVQRIYHELIKITGIQVENRNAVLPMILFGNGYEMIEKIYENDYWLRMGEKSKTAKPYSKLTTQMMYPKMYYMPNGNLGKLSLQFLVQSHLYKNLEKMILNEFECIQGTGGIADGYTTDGRNLYICIVLELKRLNYIVHDESDKIIVCQDTQKDFLEKLMRNMGTGGDITFEVISSVLFGKSLESQIN